MLSSDTNGSRREIKGLGAAAIPRRTLTGHYARREAIVVLSCWPALKLHGSFLVACTKVKNRESLVGDRRSEALKKLKASGVPDSVIVAMVRASFRPLVPRDPSNRA